MKHNIFTALAWQHIAHQHLGYMMLSYTTSYTWFSGMLPSQVYKLQFFLQLHCLQVVTRQKLSECWNYQCKEYRHFCGRIRCANSAKRQRAARRHRGAPFFLISLYSSTCIRLRFDFISTWTCRHGCMNISKEYCILQRHFLCNTQNNKEPEMILLSCNYSQAWDKLTNVRQRDRWGAIHSLQ